MSERNDKIIILLPHESIEPQAKNQLENISELPFIFHHVAVMTDCHLGKGATVGSVIATKGAVIPAAVGVDIGCGMIAVKTKFFAKDLPENLEAMRTGIERRIPLGAGSFNRQVKGSAEKRVKELTRKAVNSRYLEIDSKWPTAIGTLGSGNHFIEVSLDES